jgi:hypothetical protein
MRSDVDEEVATTAKQAPKGTLKPTPTVIGKSGGHVGTAFPKAK